MIWPMWPATKKTSEPSGKCANTGCIFRLHRSAPSPKQRPRRAQCRKGYRGHSSDGRALEWHSRGREFDPPWLHQPPYPARGEKLIQNKMINKSAALPGLPFVTSFASNRLRRCPAHAVRCVVPGLMVSEREQPESSVQVSPEQACLIRQPRHRPHRFMRHKRASITAIAPHLPFLKHNAALGKAAPKYRVPGLVLVVHIASVMAVVRWRPGRSSFGRRSLMAPHPAPPPATAAHCTCASRARNASDLRQFRSGQVLLSGGPLLKGHG